MAEKNPGVVAAGAIVSGLAASLCCIGPLVVVALNVGSAGLFLKMERFRPLFAVLTVGLLGAAFWLYERKLRADEACCTVEPDEVTQDRASVPVRVRRFVGRYPWWLWAAVVVSVVSLMVPYFIQWWWV